jgi:NADH-quinone oxidoreductase subunit C
MNFDFFVDELALDVPSASKRFRTLTYLRSFSGAPLFILSLVSASDPHLISLEHIYPGANWAEREIFDMFGLFFRGHSDLRRILTDYGFDGFPLRKDFPVSGYSQIRYNETYRRLVYEPVEFPLQYRNFKFEHAWSNRWEGV